MSRLSEEEKTEFGSLVEILDDPTIKDKTAAFSRFGALCSKADAHDPIEWESEAIACRPDIFKSVWKDASELRKSGRLLDLGKRIDCPVVAIHGDYDPHPAEGVQNPLSAVLRDFRFVLLENCGHVPWIERKAKDKFYEVLKRELR
jgi:pimeloyl-ACP methyl ester carboxylesterase